MIDISFELNGKEVNPNNFGNALESIVLDSVSDSIQKSIGSLSCTEHHKKAKILVKGKNLKNLSFEVSGCCDNLMNEVQHRLA